MNFIATPAILRELSARLCFSPEVGFRAEALGLGFIEFEAATFDRDAEVTGQGPKNHAVRVCVCVCACSPLVRIA